MGLLLAACLGSGAVGVASSSVTVGVVGATRVGSRQTLVAAAVLMLVCGFVPKAASLCAVMPLAVVCGILSATCGIISSVGLSIGQFAKTTPRNLFIAGFGK